MPLVELYAREVDLPQFQASELCSFLEKLFAVDHGIVQVMMVPVKDLGPEQVYLSLRAKGTPPRKEKIGELLAQIEKWLSTHGVAKGKLRIELFEPSQQAVHAWGASKL
mmetsp:Transcript_98422/g.228249  ORF Transcript_98422/g.228249 Transcript_98422/m.228249 type:complete len:109 (-) Transcript_98422:113-439(-)|eukprot:CAMPEP_0171057260 /NCGR_PEP_ID=MMETSP0766_2-20121228/1654_1 /TAXON_ID=439317 /ORGANISM="Gambierdiscus australes, Strain CAWD 149" /LENGTH=108 /DNA_ID=CAMNT_0011512321 /DNA_START=58 /DNA_END=384 /DNA_ORIENTATION=-